MSSAPVGVGEEHQRSHKGDPRSLFTVERVHGTISSQDGVSSLLSAVDDCISDVSVVRCDPSISGESALDRVFVDLHSPILDSLLSVLFQTAFCVYYVHSSVVLRRKVCN